MTEVEEQPPATRERIVRTVDRLFYQNGIRAVGVNEIVKELGISKKTLYRHFRSKGEMIEAYLLARSSARPILITSEPPVEQILASFEWVERSLAKAREFRGCAFLNAIAELGDDEPQARSIAVAYKESRRTWFRDLLAKLEVDDPEGLATQLSILIDGAYAAVLTHNDPTMARPATAAARILLKNAGVKLGSVRPVPDAGKPQAPPKASRAKVGGTGSAGAPRKPRVARAF
jgi:AcrR family transcriptional regulator